MHFSRSSLVAFQVWAFALALSEATSPEDFDADSPVGEEVIPLKVRGSSTDIVSVYCW